MKHILSELISVFEKLPVDFIERTVSILNNHDCIFVYAAGRSGLMLKAFVMRLAQMGRTVCCG